MKNRLMEESLRIEYKHGFLLETGIHCHQGTQRSANEKGQGLLEVIIAIGIMGIMMLGFASMMSSQYRETGALEQKLAAMDLEKLLIASLADGTVCQYVLNNPTVLTFDSTAALPRTISLPSPDASG
jgi:hypothetical protein